MQITDEDKHILARWRLILGESAEEHGITSQGDATCERIEQLVGYVFDSDTGGAQPERSRERDTGPGSATLRLPDWVNHVRELFPNKAKEVLEKALIQRRGLSGLLEDPRLLEKVEPSLDLVKTLLTNKELLNPKTRVLAEKVIKQVVEELKKKMQIQVESAVTGALRRDRHSPRKVFRNLDLKKTINRNLKNFDKDSGKLLVDSLYFFACERKRKPWHVIVTVDQSGSMMESTIFSAVMASIFYELPALRTSLILYDTVVVDLSQQVGSPVDVLMATQLGGGNDTPLALRYANQLVTQPSRTILVLISDFYEGGGEKEMVRLIKEMGDSGIRTIGIAALSYDARPEYCKATAKKLRKAGMDILVCTPEELANCMGRIIMGR